ncbi:MAG TPA: hypothetical protein VNZ03_12395 [Terriglobales bacterium]|jgi:hypothetical protein|nr:hypothetical protein [Terriglobales bacterium]
MYVEAALLAKKPVAKARFHEWIAVVSLKQGFLVLQNCFVPLIEKFGQRPSAGATFITEL